MTQRMHLCPSCRRDLPPEAFGAHARKRDGRDTYCRACKADRQRAYRATARGRELARESGRRAKARRRATSGGPRGASPAA